VAMEHNNVYRFTGEILRSIIKEKGLEILNDTQALEAQLKEKHCDEKTLYQVLLVIKVSNFNRYIPQIRTGISMVDINNIVSCTEKETGFSKKTIKAVLSSIFYGLSLPTALESVVLPADKGEIIKDVALIEFEQYESKLKEIDRAINERDNEKIVEYAADLELMAKAGHPEALYLKGLCYYCGIGTEENFHEAQRYLQTAAKGGSIRANALLGDLYFNERTLPDYDRAFKHYTVIGAVAFSPKRQKNVQIILQQKDTNVVDVGLSVALWVVMLIFNIMLGSGTFSFDGASHWITAIISIVLSTAVLAFGVLDFLRTKYNSVKWIVPCMAVVTMLFAMIAL